MRIHWMTATALLISVNAFADATLEQKITACATHSDKLERLICFDNIANSLAGTPSQTSTSTVPQATIAAAPVVASPAPVVTESAVKSEPAVTAVAPAASVNTQEAEFGLKQKVQPEQEITKLYSTVTEVKKDPYGALIVTLDNNQVWKQIESRRFKLKAGHTIFVEKAALGSFVLGSDDRNSTIRVKRLK